jgi:hypothetical protein
MEVEMTGGAEVTAPNQPSGGNTASNEPSAIELREDTLVRVPGQQNPVKYGEYYKGFQSQFTRKAQEAAELQRKYQELEKRHNEYQEQTRRASQPSGQPASPASQMVEKLKSLSYLSGEEAANVVESLVGHFGQFDNALKQRDQVLLALAQHIQKQNQMLNGITSKSSSAEFEGKIDRWVGSMGLPPEAKELAQEIYLAYEGDDLDNEFPAIFQKRWQQIEGIVRANDKRRAEEARRLPFTPRTGGNSGPSRPLNSGFKSAKEIADEMFPMVSE